MAGLSSAILKQMYKPGVETNTYKTGGPFWAALQKTTDFGGKNKVITQRYANPAGRSATFADSQSGRAESQFGVFTMTRSSDYANIAISNEDIEAALVQGDQALAELMEHEGNGAFQQITNSLHHGLWQNGGGAMGVAGTPSTTSLPLATRSDIARFYVGQEIVASDYDGTGSGTDRSGSATITGITMTGTTATLVTDANWTTQITSLTAGDYLFVKGDRGLKIKGVPAWVPYTAPGSTAFFGQDRTEDILRLSGTRVDGSTGTIEEALQLLDGEIGLFSEAVPNRKGFMNTKDYAQLLIELGPSRQRQAEIEVAGVGFKGVYVDGPGGSTEWYADNEVPLGYAWSLDMDSWKWYGLGRTPRLLTTGDDLSGLRLSDADSTEARFVYRGQLGCDRLIGNGVVKLPTAA